MLWVWTVVAIVCFFILGILTGGAIMLAKITKKNFYGVLIVEDDEEPYLNMQEPLDALKNNDIIIVRVNKLNGK